MHVGTAFAPVVDRRTVASSAWSSPSRRSNSERPQTMSRRLIKLYTDKIDLSLPIGDRPPAFTRQQPRLARSAEFDPRGLQLAVLVMCVHGLVPATEPRLLEAAKRR